MPVEDSSQLEKELRKSIGLRQAREAVVPNSKAKFLDQVREVMRLKHYSTGAGWSAVYLSGAPCEWGWQYVFPANPRRAKFRVSTFIPFPKTPYAYLKVITPSIYH